nr:hypothetical protein BaRGS_027343 [Batillaria attramentaria]
MTLPDMPYGGERYTVWQGNMALPDGSTVEEVPEPEEPELEDRVSEAGEAPQDSAAEAEQAAAVAAEAKALEEKKKKKFKPYRGKVKSAGVSKMTESLDETEMKMITAEIEAAMPPQEVSGNLLTMPASCSSILKVQNGRPPGTKDVEYDEMGNVIAVMKLDPEKLPSHRVSVKYQVVDPSVEAAQARLEAMRRGRYVGPTQQHLAKTKPKRSLHSDLTVATSSAAAGGKLISIWKFSRAS